MDTRRRALIFLILIGGPSVLGSYVLAFVLEPTIRTGLWGGVPDAIRPLYTVNMLLAAVGFFPVTWLLGFQTPIDEFRGRTGLAWEALIGSYAAILMPSALWLPLTAIYLQNPSPGLWVAIRLVLFAVGAGATALGYMLIRRASLGSPFAQVAVLAFFFFWLQTAVLDALVWPWFYPA